MVHDIWEEEHDMWMYDLGITADVASAADGCPRGKPHLRVYITTEHSQTSFATHMACFFSTKASLT